MKRYMALVLGILIVATPAVAQKAEPNPFARDNEAVARAAPVLKYPVPFQNHKSLHYYNVKNFESTGYSIRNGRIVMFYDKDGKEIAHARQETPVELRYFTPDGSYIGRQRIKEYTNARQATVE